MKNTKFIESNFVKSELFYNGLDFTLFEVHFLDAILYIPVRDLRLVVDRVDVRKNGKTYFLGQIENDLIEFCAKKFEAAVIEKIQSLNLFKYYASNIPEIPNFIQRVRKLLTMPAIPFLVQRHLLVFINKLRYVRVISKNYKYIEEAIQLVHENHFVCEIKQIEDDTWNVAGINATIKKISDYYLVSYKEDTLLMCEIEANIICKSKADAKLYCNDLALRLMESKL